MAEEMRSTAVRQRPRISRAFLDAQRRRRFAAGAAELADEFGVGEITVTMLCQVGHSARNTFYDLFSSGADCMRHTAALGCEALFATAPDPGGASLDPARVTGALCEAAATEPALVGFLLVHSPAVPMGEGDVTVDSAAGRLAGLLAARRPGAIAGVREEFVAWIYLSMLAARLREGRSAEIGGLPQEIDPWALALLDRGGRGAGRP